MTRNLLILFTVEFGICFIVAMVERKWQWSGYFFGAFILNLSLCFMPQGGNCP